MALHIDSKMQESPKNRCRICLEATNGKIELNQTIHYKETGILVRELLEYCVNEQVYENGKADGVCFDCMEKGTVYYGFKRLFKISQDVLLKEMEGNNGFSFEIKVEEDFEVESFAIKSEDIVIKPEILEEEEMEQVKENPNECKMALQTDYNMLGNAKNRCRICLEATNGKIELNQTIHYKETGILLRELLEFCVNEQVYENGKADVLCLDCLEKGMVCNEFKRRFKVSQAVLLKEMDENNGFSYAIKAEENFPEGSFEVKSENIVIKDELFEDEELEQVKENPTKCKLPTTITETEKSTPTTTRSDKLTSTLSGDKPTLTPPDDKPTISLGQKECVEHKWELCEKTLKLRSSLQKHTQKPRNRCSYVQESSASLVQDMRNDIQQQILINTDPILQSTETDEPTTKNDHTCKYCGKTLSHAGNLMIHMRIHTGEKPFSCKDCGLNFSRAGNLESHRRTHTGEKPFSCKDCGLNFSRAGNLESHRRTHTGEKPYSCKECGRSFAQRSAVKVHQVVHTKQRDHVCQKCGATFARAVCLRKHVVIHSTERPSYKCTICKKSFRSNGGKREHMRTHTGVQNYSCEFCGKRFYRSCSLNVHRKIHTGETPHICKVCGKGYIQAQHLRKHMNTHLIK